jgi:hypothetical protein
MATASAASSVPSMNLKIGSKRMVPKGEILEGNGRYGSF